MSLAVSCGSNFACLSLSATWPENLPNMPAPNGSPDQFQAAPVRVACAGRPTAQAMNAGPSAASASIAPSTRRGDALSIARWPRMPDPPSLASIPSSVIAPPVIARRDVIVSGKGSAPPAAGRRGPNIGLLNLQGSFELRAFFRGKPRFAIRLCREPGRRHLYAERHVAIDAAAHLQLQLARAFARRHEPFKAQQRDQRRALRRCKAPIKANIGHVRFDQSPANRECTSMCASARSPLTTSCATDVLSSPAISAVACSFTRPTRSITLLTGPASFGANLSRIVPTAAVCLVSISTLSRPRGDAPLVSIRPLAAKLPPP